MKFKSKGAVLVQIAPLFISQPRNPNQSIPKRSGMVEGNGTTFLFMNAGVLAGISVWRMIIDIFTVVKIHKYAYASCNALQHTTAHCNTLQHTATHCNTLQRTATYYNTLQHTATHCNTLQHTATHCNALQHTTTHGNTLQQTTTGLDIRIQVNIHNANSYIYTTQSPARAHAAMLATRPTGVCVAVCCSVLQCVLQCVAVCCDVGDEANGSVLQCVAVCCSVLQCVAVCCSVL